MPTLHPAAVLRGGGQRSRRSRADFVHVKRRLAAMTLRLRTDLGRADARARGRARRPPRPRRCRRARRRSRRGQDDVRARARTRARRRRAGHESVVHARAGVRRARSGRARRRLPPRAHPGAARPRLRGAGRRRRRHDRRVGRRGRAVLPTDRLVVRLDARRRRRRPVPRAWKRSVRAGATRRDALAHALARVRRGR